MDLKILKQLCQIHAPCGEEAALKEFLLAYVRKHSSKWKVQPKIIAGPQLQDSFFLVFGTPRTAVLAHMDSIGFTVRYQNQLVPIGGPHAETGIRLVGEDKLGPIDCELVEADGHLSYRFGRAIERGTSLVFKPHWRETKTSVQCCYLDNRLGIYNVLRLCETLEDGIIAFTTWEEHGGGAVPIVARMMYEEWGVQQALISDITWVTEGVHAGQGVVVSMRDRNIPRRSYINRIIKLAEESGVDFQLEVEGGGSSDGRELQQSPYPIDWCFVGAPEDNVHSPDEIVDKHDIEAMLKLYQYLMKEL